MQLYRGTGRDLDRRLTSGSLIPELLDRFRFQHGSSPSPSERHSWQRSLPHVARLLRTASLDDVQVLVEYQLPLTSYRADVVLVGAHPAGGVSVVIVENKSHGDQQRRQSELIGVPGLVTQNASSAQF